MVAVPEGVSRVRTVAIAAWDGWSLATSAALSLWWGVVCWARFVAGGIAVRRIGGHCQYGVGCRCRFVGHRGFGGVAVGVFFFFGCLDVPFYG